MRAIIPVLTAIAISSVGAQAQEKAATTSTEQIAAAVTALPKDMQAGARVIDVNTPGKTAVLREGTNDMICLAPDLAAKSFHSACYHKSMEPFMARGRELRAQGVKDAQVDTVRFADVKSGKLKMPTQPSMLYQIFGGTFDAATGKVTGGNSLYVTYIPFATAASTGISDKPSQNGPWIMYPGTPKAHIMYKGTMQ